VKDLQLKLLCGLIILTVIFRPFSASGSFSAILIEDEIFLSLLNWARNPYKFTDLTEK